MGLGNKNHNYYARGSITPKPELTKCANCGEYIEASKITGHTIYCYRKSIRCKICGEKIQRSMKTKHLTSWRSSKKIMECLDSDDEEDFNLVLDHGVNPEAKINDKTLLHLCASCNANDCLLALISRGVDVDPLDAKGLTPLQLAIEKKNKKIVATLIELGANIECK